MRKWILLLLSVISALVSWAAIVVIGTSDGWLHQRIAPAGDRRVFMDAMVSEINMNYRGNVAFVLIEAGKVYDEYFASIAEPVDGNTLFQVASLSKWITAWGIMALVDEGKLDLDAPVSNYLTRWNLPASIYDNNAVTARRLLSHTAGLTDGLGYRGFAPGSNIQSLEESLTQAEDSSSDQSGKVSVGYMPGTDFKYSGGGYTLLQLLIEELSTETFTSYMQRVIFKPLNMSSSTYLIDDNNRSKLATSYHTDGTPAIQNRFTALAAASFYTNTADMTRFLQAHLPGPAGEPAGGGILKSATLKLMQQPNASKWGADIWGLGTILYAPDNNDGFVIGHGGKRREPAINSTARVNPSTGDGIIILETGNPLLATTLAGEWVFWKTGNIDLMMFSMAMDSMVTTIVIGWLVIILICLLIAWRFRKKYSTLEK